MEKPLKLEDFYAKSLNRVPKNLQTDIGHFNVFNTEEFAGPKPKPVPYNRKEYYKVSLIIGNSRVHYADKLIEIKKQGLLFASPQIPYNWEQVDERLTGYFCVFTDSFFHQYGNLNKYPVFQPDGNPIFDLSDEDVSAFKEVYQKMFAEINSDYQFKYDVLRNLVLELVHSALKLTPAKLTIDHHSNASERISSLFLELLERQFPIDNPSQHLNLRTPSDFAHQLSIHVNHLNRALKEITGKSTTQIITERVLQEAKILLVHSNWSVAEISYCLGFNETSNFSSFFKKNTNFSPNHYRKEVVV